MSSIVHLNMNEFEYICGLLFTVTSSGEELRTVIVLHFRHCSIMPVAEVGAAALRPLPDPWQYDGVRISRVLYSAHHHHSYLWDQSTTSWGTHPLHHKTYPQHPANVTVAWREVRIMTDYVWPAWWEGWPAGPLMNRLPPAAPGDQISPGTCWGPANISQTCHRGQRIHNLTIRKLISIRTKRP